MTAPASAGPTAWAHMPERSNQFIMRAMAWISLRLGRRIGRMVLPPITAYFLLFAPSRRRASRNYLRRALGTEPRWRDLYRHFFTFAATVHDRLYLVQGRFDLFVVEVHGQELLDRLLDSGHGVFLIGAHLGSFEVIRALGRTGRSVRVAMVMHEDNARKINALLAAINPEAMHDIIGLGRADSMLKVWECLEDGYAIGMLADRTLGNDTLRPARILGADTVLPEGPFRMAALLRRPIIFMAGLYLGGNRYAIHFETLADFSAVARGQQNAAMQTALTRYAALLDQYCAKAPYNWFNFYEFWPAATVTQPLESAAPAKS